jgi:hypothetical protein
MEFVHYPIKKKREQVSLKLMATSVSILSTFSGFRLTQSTLYAYKPTKFLLAHEFHYGYPDGNPYIAEYKDTAGAAQCGEHLMALPDHRLHKASL